MPGNKNFDKELRLKLGREQYHLNKSKAGRSGSSAGQPRPYAKQNIAKARLHSPLLIGTSITVAPKHPFLTFRVGQYYDWHIIDKGVGEINGYEIEANQIIEHFIVVPKRRTNEKDKPQRPH